jgi:hypothetical protein
MLLDVGGLLRPEGRRCLCGAVRSLEDVATEFWTASIDEANGKGGNLDRALAVNMRLGVGL